MFNTVLGHDVEYFSHVDVIYTYISQSLDSVNIFILIHDEDN